MYPRIKFSFAVCILAVTLSCGEDQKAHAGNIQFVLSDPSVGRCLYNRVKISSKGDVVIWKSQTRDLLSPVNESPTFLTIGKKADGEYKFYRIPAPLALEPISWTSSGDAIIVRYQNREIGKISIATMTYSSSTPLSRSFSDVHIVSHAAFDENILRSNGLLQALSDNKRERNAVRQWLVFDGANFKSYILNNNLEFMSSLDPGALIYGPFARNPQFSKKATSIDVKFDGYQEMSLHSYERPYIDEASGQIFGYFRPIPKNEMSTNKSNNNILDAVKITQDISKHELNLAELSYDKYGSLVLKTGKIKKPLTNKYKLCRSIFDKNESIKNLNETEFDVNTIDFSGSSIYGQHSLLYKLNPISFVKPSLVIYFHGGPASTTFDDLFPAPVKHFFDQNVHVLAVEYHGSAGSESARSLFANNGMQAITVSTDNVEKWLRSNRRDYSDVVVIAESFGAVPARILQQKSERLITKFFYIAPLLRFQAASSWITNEKISISSQEIFENGVFGGEQKRNLFAADLGQLWANTIRNPKSYFFFGGNDKKSQPDHLVDRGQPDSEVSITVYNNLDHNSISGSERMWTDIKKNFGTQTVK